VVELAVGILAAVAAGFTASRINTYFDRRFP
jgi:hypothetical protein